MRAQITAVVLALGAGQCLANDSTAELRTGGLVLTRTPDIDMRSEELSISVESVSVRYTFFNRSAKDVATLVAFPMPDISGGGDGEDIAIPEATKDNFLDFQTAVNGAPVPVTLEQRAIVGNVDATDYLRSLGIPLLPKAKATYAALDGLPKDKWNDLVGHGLATINNEGASGEKHLDARWTLKSAYSWTQVFPAGKEITVEHRYRPSVGSSVGTSLTIAGNKDADYIRDYCIDPDILSAIGRAKKQGQDAPPFSERRISYVLKSGANWAAPIGDFRLVIDKGDPKNLLSFCGEGVRKINPTRFEMQKSNFLPKTDLNILILVPLG